MCTSSPSFVEKKSENATIMLFQPTRPPFLSVPSVAQKWLQANCSGFTDKNEWPPNSPCLNPRDYHIWGAMLEKYYKLQPKPKTTDESKVALQTIWEEPATRTHRESGGKTVLSS